jgi:hypothetical protein
MKTFLRTRAGVTVAVLVVLLALLALTNPSEGSHEAAIRKALKKEHPIAEGWFRLGALWTSTLAYDNYLIASRTTHQKTTVSIGVLGYVHVMGLPK